MLTGLEYTQLADLLKLVQNKPEEGQDALPLENGEVNESHQKKLKKQESPEHQPKKRLKKHNSDVSMDSQGFPSFLKTPDHEKKGMQTQAGSCKRGLAKRCMGKIQSMGTSRQQWVWDT